jgi:hypothetical protein
MKDCPWEIIIQPLAPMSASIPWEKLYLNYAVHILEDDPPAQSKLSKAYLVRVNAAAKPSRGDKRNGKSPPVLRRYGRLCRQSHQRVLAAKT